VANRRPSHKGEAATRPRRAARRTASCGRSPGEGDRAATVILQIMRESFRNSCCCEVGQAMPAGNRLAGACDDRHAHPTAPRRWSPRRYREMYRARCPRRCSWQVTRRGATSRGKGCALSRQSAR